MTLRPLACSASSRSESVADFGCEPGRGERVIDGLQVGGLFGGAGGGPPVVDDQDAAAVLPLVVGH
jgi:hypothetical protein